MAYYCAVSFPTREDAKARLNKDGFEEHASGVFTRTRNNIHSCVDVGQCRTGEWIISVAPPPANVTR